jgi:hypothetical protein
MPMLAKIFVPPPAKLLVFRCNLVRGENRPPVWAMPGLHPPVKLSLDALRVFPLPLACLYRLSRTSFSGMAATARTIFFGNAAHCARFFSLLKNGRAQILRKLNGESHDLVEASRARPSA